MRRRDFIAALGGAVVARPLSAPAQERVRRVGVLIRPPTNRNRRPHRGAPPGASGSRLVRWAQRADRCALERGRYRAPAQRRGGTGHARLGRSGGRCRPDHRDVATNNPHRADCVRPGPRSGRHGFVRSLARPGGNASGFTQFEYSLSGKWLELLRELAPQVTRVGVVRDMGGPAGVGQWAVIQAFASPMGVELSPIDMCASRATPGATWPTLRAVRTAA